MNIHKDNRTASVWAEDRQRVLGSFLKVNIYGQDDIGAGLCLGPNIFGLTKSDAVDEDGFGASFATQLFIEGGFYADLAAIAGEPVRKVRFLALDRIEVTFDAAENVSGGRLVRINASGLHFNVHSHPRRGLFLESSDL